MQCDGITPNVVPASITKVTIYGASLEKILNFTHPGWANLSYLSINPGESMYHKSKYHAKLCLHMNLKG